ncbi:I78 family peptidase inhibitor [Erythrobacter sp. QSSC1-22B]|uniref:I78 family peptidase inhibitor n=1 Tax=Erythrobacter sp. QSSC1-22B TaxID=1860125 RepID=UPI0009F51D20|nr:I78 family peptidase inhibitor [Erythrobacter sp. QSSC1-22B]
MILRFISCALAPMLITACVQDIALVADVEAQNGPSAGTAVTAPPLRGSVNPREPTERFSGAFEICDGEAMHEWIGRQFDAASETTLLSASGAASLRPVRPGQVISMDYQSDRLTIELDGADVILSLRCG